jgi:hypothetical protein
MGARRRVVRRQRPSRAGNAITDEARIPPECVTRTDALVDTTVAASEPLDHHDEHAASPLWTA